MPIQLNSIVDRGINTALTRRLGLLADATVSLMPELAPTLALQSMPEMDFHMGWRKYMVSGSVPALAGNQGTVRIRMPRSATVLCIIEAFWMGNTPADEITIAGIINTVDLATLLGAQVRDTIQPATKPGVCAVSSEARPNNGFGGGCIMRADAVPVAPVFPLILRPSLIPGSQLDGFEFQRLTVNAAMDFTLLYRERVLNDQENVV